MSSSSRYKSLRVWTQRCSNVHTTLITQHYSHSTAHTALITQHYSHSTAHTKPYKGSKEIIPTIFHTLTIFNEWVFKREVQSWIDDLGIFQRRNSHATKPTVRVQIKLILHWNKVLKPLRVRYSRNGERSMHSPRRGNVHISIVPKRFEVSQKCSKLNERVKRLADQSIGQSFVKVKIIAAV